MNRWNIPTWMEREIIARDTSCIYCGVEFGAGGKTRKMMPSWEHIVNDARIITRENIARCCIACNASKGAKLLSEWLNSNYCKIRTINIDTIAPVVKRYLG
jgi:biotin synthase-like enzyme